MSIRWMVFSSLSFFKATCWGHPTFCESDLVTEVSIKNYPGVWPMKSANKKFGKLDSREPAKNLYSVTIRQQKSHDAGSRERCDFWFVFHCVFTQRPMTARCPRQLRLLWRRTKKEEKQHCHDAKHRMDTWAACWISKFEWHGRWTTWEVPSCRQLLLFLMLKCFEHCLRINLDRFTDSGPLVEFCKKGFHSCAAISHPKNKWLMKNVEDEISCEKKLTINPDQSSFNAKQIASRVFFWMNWSLECV